MLTPLSESGKPGRVEQFIECLPHQEFELHDRVGTADQIESCVPLVTVAIRVEACLSGPLGGRKASLCSALLKKHSCERMQVQSMLALNKKPDVDRCTTHYVC